MTAKERTTVQAFINKISKLQEEQDKYFTALQDLNKEEGDGHRWCSASYNRDKIVEIHHDDVTAGRAENLYKRYVECGAQIDLIQEFGQSLAELGFWKKK